MNGISIRSIVAGVNVASLPRAICGRPRITWSARIRDLETAEMHPSALTVHIGLQQTLPRNDSACMRVTRLDRHGDPTVS